MIIPTQTEIVADMEARAAALNVRMYLVCQEAGIAPTTFYRWKDGSPANLGTIEKINAVLSHMEETANLGLTDPVRHVSGRIEL